MRTQADQAQPSVASFVTWLGTADGHDQKEKKRDDSIADQNPNGVWWVHKAEGQDVDKKKIKKRYLTPQKMYSTILVTNRDMLTGQNSRHSSIKISRDDAQDLYDVSHVPHEPESPPSPRSQQDHSIPFLCFWRIENETLTLVPLAIALLKELRIRTGRQLRALPPTLRRHRRSGQGSRCPG